MKGSFDNQKLLQKLTFMTLHFKITSSKSNLEFYYMKPEKQKSPKPFNPFILIAALLIICLFAAKPFITYDEDGTPKLAQWRQKKLIKELNDLDRAEQYVLLAEEDGVYPCYSCIGSSTIRLKEGQVWKYGMTTKGQKGRYGAKLPDKKLYYVIQFEGTVEKCLKEEKRKIYFYVILPENIARNKPLIRPPGNKKDS